MVVKAKKKKMQAFDPEKFLSTVNGGRSLSSYRKNKKVFQQGDKADAVFYVREGKVKVCVKWFNPTKGYGFIEPSGGRGTDIFVHISAVEKAGLSTLQEGQLIEYEEVPNKGRTAAEKLKVL